MSKLTLPAAPEEGGLRRYVREIWKFPVLKPEEEYMLAKRWRERGDVDAAHELVTSHLRLVAKIAFKFKGYGLPVEDLVAEGNIGLMKAVKKFEPDRGFRLATYAIWWIRASITEYILRSWSMVKMGTVAAQKKLFFSLRGVKSRLNILDNGELTPEQAQAISAETGVRDHEVMDMNRRLSFRDSSLNAPVGEDDGVMEFQDTLVDESPSPESLAADSEEREMRLKLLNRAMERLDERERHIFIERRLTEDPKTLEDLGAVYGVSRERVRQLEARAFEKVRAHIAALSPGLLPV